MKKFIEILKLFVSGAINGLILGICLSVVLFIYFYIRELNNPHSGITVEINWFLAPIYLMFIVGIIRTLACQVFRICTHSVIGWQVIGLFTFLGSLALDIALQLIHFIENKNSIGFSEEFIYISKTKQWILVLFSISIFNFFYSFALKIPAGKRTHKLN